MTEDTFTPAPIPDVYRAISAVQADLAKAGIRKDQTNQFDRYKFRGIDDVYNAIGPLLPKHGLCVLPRMLSRDVQERTSDKNKALFYVTVEAEYDFVSSKDGSKHVARVYGEAMDRGDKGTNKAMSAAYKMCIFQTFAIPTEGENDADHETHKVKAKRKPATVTGAQVAAFNQLTQDMDPEHVMMGLEQHGVSDFRELDKKKADGILKTLRKRVNQPKSGTVSKLSDEEAAKAEKVSKKWADGGDDLASEFDAEDAQTEANYRPVIEAEEPPPPPENHNALWHKTGTDKWYEFYDGTWTFYDGPKPEPKK